MRLPGRLAAAIEVLADIEAHRRPVAEALKAWGLAHRFAGAGDRAAIGNLVYDALRRRASHGWVMQADDPRALVLAVAVRDWRLAPDALNAAFADDRFAPQPVTDAEAARLADAEALLAGAPDHVRADMPEWLVPSLKESFGKQWVEEGIGLSARPPLDLRVNTLKSDRNRVMKNLRRFAPVPTALAPEGIRIVAGEADSRTPNVQIDEAFIKGWFEVQDEGSQIVSLLAGARPGEQVLDLCAGAGGKTLAMAAMMGNRGQIFAYDAERARLAPIYDRLKRNGVRNAQVRPPEDGVLDDLAGRMDRVVVDAPCTGAGTWRRRPDAKWKLTAEQVAQRATEQAAILDRAAGFVKSGGELVYITCSILPEENEGQVSGFLSRHPDFSARPPADIWGAAFGPAVPLPAHAGPSGLSLTPASTGTDGFFLGILRRN